MAAIDKYRVAAEEWEETAGTAATVAFDAPERAERRSRPTAQAFCRPQRRAVRVLAACVAAIATAVAGPG